MSAKKHRKLRRECGFEFNPPRCVNCENYVPPMHGVPGKSVYREARCNDMGFVVFPNSICDRWVGKDGETLE